MSGAQNGARKPPLAPSTWMSMSSPVSACSSSRAAGQLGHRLVGAGVGHAESRHHHDRVLVHPLEHVVGVHRVVAVGHRDLAHLDVPVPGELVPHHLHRAAHHVGLVGGLARPPAAWRASATWPPSRPACTPPTSRSPRRPRCWPPPGAFHRSAIMCTHRRSISAVCGYSSLSIMFLSTDSSIRACTSGSSHVWQNVARFWRALPSSISSSDTSWNASLGSVPSCGKRYLGTGLARSRSANTQSSSSSRMVSRSCSGMIKSPRSGPRDPKPHVTWFPRSP